MASQPSASNRAITAAGAVVFGPGKRVLLVHRPKYDDWSFPKGKLEPGEHATAAAVREVAEETGLHVRLTHRLGDQEYPTSRGDKTVHYWNGRVVGDDDVSGYRPNEEIDGVAWVGYEEARERLSYTYDRRTLETAYAQRRRTSTLVVLRHDEARSRKAWRRDDRERPLLAAGREHAERLVPILAAYDVRRLVSSSSLRCVETLTPYADLTGWKLETRERLTEEAATSDGVASVVAALVDDLTPDGGGVVLCTHRPVLPRVWRALGMAEVDLDPGELVVAQLRKGTVTSNELHRVR